MNKIISRIFAVFTALSLAAAPVCAAAPTDGAEAAKRFRQAARAINREGLIAETAPITGEEIAAACQLLEHSPERLYELVNGFLSRMDTHSAYLAPVSYGNSFTGLVGYAGVGVVVRHTALGFFVEEVVRHSPADAAGLQPGDRLCAIDGDPTEGKTLDDVSAALRGDANTLVSITFVRNDKECTVELTRAVIRDPEVDHWEIAKDVHYIEVTGFSSAYTPQDFAEALTAVDPGDDLILDLRGNGGGVLDYALEMAEDLLTGRTLMCTLRTRTDQGGRTEIRSDGSGLALDDLIVLVDDGTASAAELMAGVLQEAGGAVLVGETTYGKGQGQYHMTMPSDDVLVITALEMELPVSGCWEGKGLTPDVGVSLQRMAQAVGSCTPLDAKTIVRYGERSDNVRAMTERLALLGYLAQATDTFDTPVLSALRAFQADAGADTTIHAHPETLALIEQMIDRAVRGNYFTDTQLNAALLAAQT